MAYEDISYVCADCGQETVFTAKEQEFFDEKGFTSPPKRCKACRAKRKKGRHSRDGIYRSPAFEGSAPAHQRIRGRRDRRGRSGSGGYRAPAFGDDYRGRSEYRSPAFRGQASAKPENEYRAPGFREQAQIKPEEEYRAPGFREQSSIKPEEEYRAPGFQDLRDRYRDERPMFSIVCDMCKKEAMVPYLPEEKETRLCKDCYENSLKNEEIPGPDKEPTDED